jgi:hypothetical protein
MVRGKEGNVMMMRNSYKRSFHVQHRLSALGGVSAVLTL